MSKMHRYRLNIRNIREFTQLLKQLFNVDFDRKASWEAVKIDREREIYIVDGLPAFIRIGGELYPTVICVERGAVLLPKVIIDMGAIPHIANGADIMMPGVVRIEGSFKDGCTVAVADEKYGKILAVARSLISSDIASEMSTGRGFKNIHHVGDVFWKTMKNLGLV
ncbi:DUF1947 domain-containing protein [Candidatus Bathyarchaeota archaeon]|nr:DUF1947 domain-containing protein [Candidatus Bathyarchaeota archaeon]MBS7612780.1 DUF1947 domain-containing protein [Candidatus Bathyarchaeota archaeon]MBS7618717.1 DUF1947 domain-containing protein [Candidatus Bathyarchaeota archaeon]